MVTTAGASSKPFTKIPSAHIVSSMEYPTPELSCVESPNQHLGSGTMSCFVASLTARDDYPPIGPSFKLRVGAARCFRTLLEGFIPRLPLHLEDSFYAGQPQARLSSRRAAKPATFNASLTSAVNPLQRIP
ncbi:hypothetical protein C8F04DRAFT_1254471 [Mycena alexandri]|uniref:Uncharacterized protein n=1 Tax=Mycena alexandri TaxID=1745969 RepID=A0AAD6T9W0_9AGAR|nr:hypothetical protein C8F04DRAFT_1254471 [Mycena alexandri]